MKFLKKFIVTCMAMLMLVMSTPVSAYAANILNGRGDGPLPVGYTTSGTCTVIGGFSTYDGRGYAYWDYFHFRFNTGLLAGERTDPAQPPRCINKGLCGPGPGVTTTYTAKVTSSSMDSDGNVRVTFAITTAKPYCYIGPGSGANGYGYTRAQATSGSLTLTAKLELSGYAKVIKTTDRKDVLNKYPITGAQFTLYTDAACTNKAKDKNGKDAILTCDSKGITNTVELKKGTYYVDETKIPEGYDKDPSLPKKITVEPKKTTPVDVKNILKPGLGRVKKEAK